MVFRLIILDFFLLHHRRRNTSAYKIASNKVPRSFAYELVHRRHLARSSCKENLFSCFQQRLDFLINPGCIALEVLASNHFLQIIFRISNLVMRATKVIVVFASCQAISLFKHNPGQYLIHSARRTAPTRFIISIPCCICALRRVTW